MKEPKQEPFSGLPRRRLLQLTAMGALAVVVGNGRQSLGAALPTGTEEDVTPPPRVAPPTVNPIRTVIGTRAPLAPSPFIALPLGSVRARGWLLRQLELQRDGLTGHAEELLPAAAPDSAWKGGTGENWEKGPYYLKGLVALAYTLDDANLKAKVSAWIEPILASGTADGFFGPKSNTDWWPRMVVTYLLRDYAEATGDARIVPFLTRYYLYMSANLPTRPLVNWSRTRVGDEIDTVLWLYNRTGDRFLLALADLLAAQGAPWSQIFTDNSFPDYDDSWKVTHNVNVPQALKMPVIYSQRSGKAEDKAAYRAALTHLMRDNGAVFGLTAGTERLSGRSSVEGVELCSIVEYMLSAETALRILGEPRIGDELELVAFNALPAALSKDIHQHVYYTLANNVKALRANVGYDNDHGNDRVPAPCSGYPCCCYNFHQGWPKLAQNSWAATPDSGLALLVYIPSQVTATVAGGQTATIICDTNYPFEDTIRLQVTLQKAARFSLQLRMPAWCQNPQIKINGRRQPRSAAGTFATLNRIWKTGDIIELTFPMSVETVRGINNSVSVRRGPLLYVLGLEENWQSVGKSTLSGFDSSEITSDSPWNYALVLDAHNPANSFQIVSKPSGVNPFVPGSAPVSLRVAGKPLESWKARFDGQLPLDPPLSPVASNARAQTLELVPFGSHMLRIAEFPVIGTPPVPSTTWSESFSDDYWQRWLINGGSFLRGGQLQLARNAKGIAPQAIFSDFVYDAAITIGDKGDAGILFRTSDVTVGINNYRGYYVGLNAETGAVTLGKANNNWTPIISQPTSITAGQVNHIRFEARGSQIRVWVNDMKTPLIEASDDTFTSGAVGIRSHSNKAVFGRLSAHAIQYDTSLKGFSVVPPITGIA